jgi:AcrR family transcriptional regulator
MIRTKITAMQPESVGRRERRRNQTREKIYRAATKLFAEKGFFETTTEEITEAADVGQGTFFNYFPTKQHVLTVLSEIQLQKIAAAQHEAASDKIAIREVLRKLTHEIAAEPGQSAALTRSLFAAFLSNEQVREAVARTMQEARDGITEIVERGKKNGEIASREKSTDLAMAFQRGVLGTLLLWAVQPKGALERRLSKAFKDFWALAVAQEE